MPLKELCLAKTKKIVTEFDELPHDKPKIWIAIFKGRAYCYLCNADMNKKLGWFCKSREIVMCNACKAGHRYTPDSYGVHTDMRVFAVNGGDKDE